MSDEKRDDRLSLLFYERDVLRWELAAAKAKSKDLTAWIEVVLDRAAAMKSPPKTLEDGFDRRASRAYPLNRRFHSARLRSWRAAAKLHGMTMTLWMERALNSAAGRRLR